MTFNATEEGSNPTSQTLQISNSGGGTLNWSVSGDTSWLSLSSTSGSSTGETDEVTVNVDISGLSAGTHTATITISATGATNTPQTTSVTLVMTTSPSEPFTDISAPLTGAWIGAVAWGDYDNDGDLDVLLMGHTGTSPVTEIYRNDSLVFTEFNFSLPQVWQGSVAWGDFDNDNDLDIFLTGSSSENGTIAKIYENDHDIFVEFPASLQEIIGSSVAWGDYDNDGDLDILFTGSTGPSSRFSIVYKNDEGNFVDISAQLQNVDRSSGVWGDFDNDGDLDILLTGSINIDQISKVYRNDEGTFIDINANLTGVAEGSSSWGDYDNDGHLDILLTGFTSFGSSPISKIYRNVNGSFEDIGASLPGVGSSSAAWGDYDNDGDLDILLTGDTGSGFISKIFRNDPEKFVDINAPLLAVKRSSVAWGDYDKDGDLDILMIGYTGTERVSKIYRNNIETANTVPTLPTSLTSSVSDSSVTLSWNKATDSQTTQNALTYNLRLGTAPGGNEIISPMADVSTGYRKIPKLGNTNHNNSWKIKNLPEGTYYWSVQAVDHAFAGSAFATEQSFTIDISPPAAPQNLQATPRDQQVTLTWDANAESDFLRYRIYGGILPNPTTVIDSVEGISNTTKTITDLTDGITYFFRITAVDMTLQESGFSNEVSATPSLLESFTKITNSGIVKDGGDSFGSSWGDYDNNGNLDLFVANANSQNNLLYRNNGDGTFAKITEGDIVKDGGDSRFGSWADYDNDGYLDLFVANWSNQNNFLYRNNGDGTFTKILQGDLVSDGGMSASGSWGDYDNDGYLDLFVANWSNQNNFLYRNNGDGTFTKILQGDIVSDGGLSGGAASWGDYNNDSYLDLFVANTNNQSNFLYRNNRDGTFTKIKQGDIVSDGGDNAGGSWGDYDNDGDMDLFVTNFGNNFLYRNNGDGTFTRITTGVIANDTGSSWSSSWGDYNNDGHLDLFVSNEFNQDNFLYCNNGDGTFAKITQSVIVNDGGRSAGASWSDYDKDGDLDLFVANWTEQNNFLYRNNGNINGWINIKCVGTVSNKSAIGTKVSVKASIKGILTWQLREISSQTGFLGQNSLNAEFGVGNASVIDSIKIEWPSGITQVLTNLSPNQFIMINEEDREDSPPASPRNLRATPGDQQLSLTWDANTESDFLRYRIYGGTSPNPTTVIDTVDGISNTNKIITDLTNGITYYFRLKAVDMAMQESFFSNQVSAVPTSGDLPPAPPQNLQASAGDMQVTLNWAPNMESDFLRYRIYGGTSPNPTAVLDSIDGISNTNKIIRNLTNDTIYYFRMTAVDLALQESDFSNEVSATIPEPEETVSVLPNPFTPNGDGYNDFVDFIFPNTRDSRSEVQIFSMSGNRVEVLSNQHAMGFRWDGTDSDGNALEPGVYIYLIQANGNQIANGTITLIR